MAVDQRYGVRAPDPRATVTTFPSLTAAEQALRGSDVIVESHDGGRTWTQLTFAWCFDHGDVHRFGPAGPWCTARWVRLRGAGRAAALADKRTRFGGARFLHELPADALAQVLAAAGRLDGAGGTDAFL